MRTFICEWTGQPPRLFNVEGNEILPDQLTPTLVATVTRPGFWLLEHHPHKVGSLRLQRWEVAGEHSQHVNGLYLFREYTLRPPELRTSKLPEESIKGPLLAAIKEWLAGLKLENRAKQPPAEAVPGLVVRDKRVSRL